MNQSLANSSPSRKLNTKFTKTLTSRLSEINEDLVKEKCDLNQSKSTANKDRFEHYTKDKKLI